MLVLLLCVYPLLGQPQAPLIRLTFPSNHGTNISSLIAYQKGSEGRASLLVFLVTDSQSDVNFPYIW